MKYIPEITLFGTSVIYLLLYILDDIHFMSVPKWLLNTDITLISLVLIMIVIFLKDSMKGEHNEQI